MIGLPTETMEDFNATKMLAKKIKSDVYVFSIATPLPGTRLFDMVNEEITPLDYALLDWNGSRLTDRINKSEIKNISDERNRLKRNYLIRSAFYSMFSFQALSIFLKRGHRIERLKSIFSFIFEMILPAKK